MLYKHLRVSHRTTNSWQHEGIMQQHYTPAGLFYAVCFNQIRFSGKISPLAVLRKLDGTSSRHTVRNISEVEFWELNP
jgi:hypothetical protein